MSNAALLEEPIEHLYSSADLDDELRKSEFVGFLQNLAVFGDEDFHEVRLALWDQGQTSCCRLNCCEAPAER
jgi:hypothetical protein